MRTTSHIMGYSNQGDGAELKAKQKSAFEKLREHQKRKEEAAKKGEKVKLDVLSDDMIDSPEDAIKSNGSATPPLTTKAVFSLTAAKKRKVEGLENGEIQSPKPAKIGMFSDRALKEKSASAQISAKPSYKGTAKPQPDRKLVSDKATARPRADQKAVPYKGANRTPADIKRPSQAGACASSVAPKQPYRGTARPPTQTRSLYNTGSTKSVKDSKIRGPEGSPKRKAEEEPARERCVKAQKTVQSATTTSTLGEPEEPEEPEDQKPSDRKLSQQKPVLQTSSPRKPSSQKPTSHMSEGAKRRNQKPSGEENTLKEMAQEQNKEKKRPANEGSDDKSSGKKRRAEDEAGDQTKKIKSGDELEKTGQPGKNSAAVHSRPSLVAPKGLDNYGMACFATSVVQCLANIPEFVDFYRAKANDTVKTEPGCILTEAQRKQFERKGIGQSREQLGKRDDLRKAFKRAKSSVRVQAYLGALFERMHVDGSAPSSVSPIEFIYALGALVEDDNGHPLDGEMQADAWEFYCRLIHHLQEEEMNSRDSHKDLTTIESLLGSQTVEIFSCALCGHSREGGQTACLSLDMDLPRVDESEEFSITQCLDTFLRGKILKDYRCDGCGKSGHVTKATRIKHTAKYAVIKLTRTDIQGKVQTKVPLPTGEVNLGSYFAGPDTESVHQYEVMGVVQHLGNSLKRGHWLASKKANGRWWLCSDANVVPLDTKRDQKQGCLFFLQKVGQASSKLPS